MINSSSEVWVVSRRSVKKVVLTANNCTSKICLISIGGVSTSYIVGMSKVACWLSVTGDDILNLGVSIHFILENINLLIQWMVLCLQSSYWTESVFKKRSTTDSMVLIHLKEVVVSSLFILELVPLWQGRFVIMLLFLKKSNLLLEWKKQWVLTFIFDSSLVQTTDCLTVSSFGISISSQVTFFVCSQLSDLLLELEQWNPLLSGNLNSLFCTRLPFFVITNVLKKLILLVNKSIVLLVGAMELTNLCIQGIIDLLVMLFVVSMSSLASKVLLGNS